MDTDSDRDEVQYVFREYLMLENIVQVLPPVLLTRLLIEAIPMLLIAAPRLETLLLTPTVATFLVLETLLPVCVTERRR